MRTNMCRCSLWMGYEWVKQACSLKSNLLVFDSSNGNMRITKNSTKVLPLCGQASYCVGCLTQAFVTTRELSYTLLLPAVVVGFSVGQVTESANIFYNYVYCVCSRWSRYKKKTVMHTQYSKKEEAYFSNSGWTFTPDSGFLVWSLKYM